MLQLRSPDATKGRDQGLPCPSGCGGGSPAAPWLSGSVRAHCRLQTSRNTRRHHWWAEELGELQQNDRRVLSGARPGAEAAQCLGTKPRWACWRDQCESLKVVARPSGGTPPCLLYPKSSRQAHLHPRYLQNQQGSYSGLQGQRREHFLPCLSS